MASDLDPVMFRRALAIYQGTMAEAAIPIEKRWADKLPALPADRHAVVAARCAELEAKFPELDHEALERTWRRGVFFSQR